MAAVDCTVVPYDLVQDHVRLPPEGSRRTFPLTLAARYVVARYPILRGSGQTIAIGAHEIILGVEHNLNPGEWIQVAVEWPACKDGVYPVELVAGGEVSRSGDGVVVIRVHECDLRTSQS